MLQSGFLLLFIIVKEAEYSEQRASGERGALILDLMLHG